MITVEVVAVWWLFSMACFAFVWVYGANAERREQQESITPPVLYDREGRLPEDLGDALDVEWVA